MFETSGLIKIANTRMPFGKYQGRVLIDLPEAYLQWFSREGFPSGELGELLALALLVNTESLKHLVEPLRRAPR